MGRALERLLAAAREGDADAFQRLAERLRPRLKRWVAIHMDRRLSARVDISDVAQEAVIQAWLHRNEFHAKDLRRFYAWLREIAGNRLIDLQRFHVGARQRSVLRESAGAYPAYSNESDLALSRALVDSISSPSAHLHLHESLAIVQRALDAISPRDREILVMRHLKQMSIEEIATALQTTRTNVSTRHLRALQNLRLYLEDHSTN